jgi:hypothetical protein
MEKVLCVQQQQMELTCGGLSRFSLHQLFGRNSVRTTARKGAVHSSDNA